MMYPIDILPILPRQLLVSLHRNLCRLRQKDFKRSNCWVTSLSADELYLYHKEVMAEMGRRSYNYAIKWQQREYRGKNQPFVFDHPLQESSLEHLNDILEINRYKTLKKIQKWIAEHNGRAEI